MSYNFIHGDRLLTRVIDPSLFSSHFLGGPSSVGIVCFRSNEIHCSYHLHRKR